MTERISHIPFGKKVKITVVEQDMPQKELSERLGIANSTVSGIIYGRSQCKQAKEHIAETLGIK